MARLLTNGAETQVPLTATASQDGQGEGFILTGTPTIATATPRIGGAYFSCAPSAVNTLTQNTTGVLDRTYYLRAGIRINANVTGAVMDVFQFRAGASLFGALRLGTLGTTTLKLVDTTGGIGASSAGLSLNTWYVLELSILIPTAGNGTLHYRIDGVPAAQGALSANVGNAVFTQVRAGHGQLTETAVTVLVDDFALNDDQGASQNSWPGLGHVIHLKPISDSAVGTGWQEADGTTDALYTNVDNEPPTGVASPTVDTQIKNASSGGPFNYDANTQTYTTGGIDADDQVVLTRAIMRLSGSSITGTNDGFGRVVSNPADAGDTTWTAAFDVVAGAEPSGWKSWITPYVYAPAVTKGTSPVIRVVKNTAATRIHMASLMVLEVEYTVQSTATGAAAIAGAGTIAASGTRTRLGAAAIAGAGTVAATATHTVVAAAAVAGAGTVSASGTRTRLGAAAVAGTGTISASGTVISGAVTGEANVTGTGTISATGTRKRLGAAAVSGTGAISATGTRKRLGSASIAGQGSISATGEYVRVGTATVSGTGTVSSSAFIGHFAEAAVTGTGTISATGVIINAGEGAIAGTGTIAAHAFAYRPWPPDFGGEWPEDQGSEWPEDQGDGWPAEVGTGWTPSSGNEWE